MTNNTGVQQRVDPKFKMIMKEIMTTRFQKGLTKFNAKELGCAEATRLLIRTPSWRKVVEELKTLPKRENLI